MSEERQDLKDLNHKNQKEKKNVYLGFCRWTKLRASGETKILKVSYFTLLLVPMLANYSNKLGIEGFPLYLKLLFFSSLFVSIGNVLYSIFCPKLIKRFDTPNDMYKANLDIYESRKRADINDGFSGDYEHCMKGYKFHNYQNIPARFACFFCLVVGGVSALVLIIERSVWVLTA